MLKKGSSLIWIYGKHAVTAALSNKKRKILKIVISTQTKDFIEDIDTRNIKIEIVDKTFFVKQFGKDVIHQGIALLAEPLKEVFLEDVLDDDRPFIFLDQVTDPQNIGSILRAAAVFGAKAVVLPESNSPELTASIMKIASGAVETVPLIKVKNLVQSIKMLKEKGYWCVGLDERGNKQLYEIDLKVKLILIIGSEGHGMRRLTRENCDFLVKLPYWKDFSTLNASQAATISLYEVLKQKRSN